MAQTVGHRAQRSGGPTLPQMDDAAIERAVREAADRTGIDYDIVACDPALADTAAFCEA